MIDNNLATSGMPLGHGPAVANDQWMRAMAYSLVRDPNLAEDIVQRTWLVALRAPAGQRSRGWLATVMRNMVRRQWREDSRRSDVELSTEPQLHAAGSDRAVVDEDLCRALRDAVSQVSEPNQTALRLRYFGGQTSVEIARVFDVPEGTVRWRLKRGLEELRGILDRDVHGGREAWMGALAVLLPRPRRAAALGAMGGAGWAWLSLTAATVAVGIWFLSRPGDTPSPAALDETDLARIDDDHHSGTGDELTADRTSDWSGDESATPGRADAVPAESEEPAPELPEEAPSPVSGQPTARLPIRVINADTEEPVPGAQILLHGETAFREVGRAAEDGAWSVEFCADDFHGTAHMLTESMASFRVVAPGYETSEIYSFSRGLLEGLQEASFVVTLFPGEVIVRGSVEDPDGRPICGARVAVGHESGIKQGKPFEGYVSTATPLEATTGEDGRFEIRGVQKGKLVARVLTDDFMVYEATQELSEAGAWEISAQLERGLVARGVVLGPDGGPVEGARVFADPMNVLETPHHTGWPGFDQRMSGFVRSTVTGSDGSYTLSGLHRGRYRLWALKDGSTPQVAVLEGAGEPGDVIEWHPTLEARPATVIEALHADGSPAAGFPVRVSNARSTRPHWRRVVWADDRGMVRIPDVSHDVLDVTICGREFENGAFAIFREVELDPATRRATVRKEAVEMATVKARIHDANGASEFGAWLVLTNMELSRAFEKRAVEPDGIAELSIPPGPVHTHVMVAGRGVAVYDVIDLRPTETHEVLLDLPAPLPVRLEPSEGSDDRAGHYSIEAHSAPLSKPNTRVDVYAGAEPPGSLELFPGQYIVRRVRPDETLSGTVLHVLPGIGGRLDPLVGEVHHVPFRTAMEGAALRADAGIEITLSTGEVVTAERADDAYWWAALPEGVHEVRLVRAGSEQGQTEAKFLEVQSFGVYPIPSLDFGR